MDKSNYFKSLVSLYESTKINEQEIDRRQANIADTGQDVIDSSMDQRDFIPSEQPEYVQPSGTDEETNFPEEDFSYLQDSEPDRTNEVVSDVSEDKKLLRLYDLFKSLLGYGKRFKKSLEVIDKDLLEEDQLKRINDYRKRVNNEIQKIEDYFESDFSSSKYEKSLYLYILLRTEFLTVVEDFRQVLGLNEN